MPKYHISPSTGRPNRCYASVKPCPIGGAEEHYTSKEAARAAYENKMQAKTLATAISKKTSPTASQAEVDELAKKVDAQLDNPFEQQGKTKKEQLQIDSAIIMGQFIQLNKDKKEVLENAEKNGFDKTLAAAKRIDAEVKNYQVMQGEIDEQLRAIAEEEAEAKRVAATQVLKETMPRQYYSDKARVAEVMANGKGKTLFPETYFSFNAGRLNPMDNTGSGSEYHEKGDSLVILAEADGKSPRAISGSGDTFREPEGQLGRRAMQTKQNTSGRDAVWYLRVVGYVAADGTRYGWIPDKQVAFFRYK